MTTASYWRMQRHRILDMCIFTPFPPPPMEAPVLASLSLWLQRAQHGERPERAGNKVGDFYIERVKMTGVEENWKRSRKAGERKGPTLLGK